MDFLSLAEIATGCLLLYWRAAFLVVFAVSTASVIAWRGARNRYRAPALGSLAQLTVPAAILLCGVMFPCDMTDEARRPEWPSRLLDCLPWAHLPVTAVLLVCYGRAWLFVLALGLATLGYSLAAVIASGMSLSGAWL